METNQILQMLNDKQKEAVLATEGPVLILAGAGSGKTRVLVHRIAYLINTLGVMPGSILAITFTNKAADEMRSRVDDMIGFGSREIWVMTFHACCVRILRRHAEELGYTRYFTIYDTDDQLTVMKEIFKRHGVDSKKFKEKGILNMISSAKNELITPDQYAKMTRGDLYGDLISDLYEEYAKRLKENNAMDFDDLIMKTVELFEKHPDILEIYRERFKYIMVDEYQDTNTAQFRFVSLLAEKYRNLCVVGDDDQSIYRFRGANIKNILNFEQIFPDSKVVKLEQNYRSTQNILDAANEVIRNNRGRKAKRLWTENGKGKNVRFKRYDSGFDEAEDVAAEIGRSVRNGERHFKDFAVLYRTNAQSRLFEEKCIFLNIPYKLVGGVNFYSRKEIKDILAYLKTIDNAVDDVATTRIINVPKRGIGAATVTKVMNYAQDAGSSFFDALCEADRAGSLSAGTLKKIRSFTKLIDSLRETAKTASVRELIQTVLAETGYTDALRAEKTEEAEDRLSNIDELLNKAAGYEKDNPVPTLSGFLEEVALIADIDTVVDTDDRVLLMTLHAAKGLEFPVVYMTGMEEGLFPSRMSMNADNPDEEIEEERRLCYVGITRAKEMLTLTAARTRMVRGEFEPHPVSRFVREISRDKFEQGRPDAAKSRLNLTRGGFGADMKNAINGTAYAPKPSFGKDFMSSPEAKSTGRTPQGTFSGTRGSYTGKPSAGTAGPFGPAGGRVGSGEGSRTGDADGIKGKAGSESGLGYAVGDQVRHVKFGVGKVLAITDSGRDYLVTADFPGWGIKKMYASFAKLIKEE